MGNAAFSKCVLLVCQHVMLVNHRHSGQLSSCSVCHISQVKKGDNAESLLWAVRFEIVAKNDIKAEESVLLQWCAANHLKLVLSCCDARPIQFH
jgi:hypothetical protein